MLLCSYPIRVIFLDDDVNFLKSLEKFFATRYRLAEYYSNVSKCLAVLNKENNMSFLDYYLRSLDEDNPEQRVFSIDVGGIYKEAKRANKEQQIGAVVIDQSLPLNNGLAILQSLNKSSYFKILLTATVDNEKAIGAFNNGHIDGFVSKNKDNMLDELTKLIDKGINEYFVKLSKPVIAAIKTDNTRKSALGEQYHKEALEEVIKKYNITEYYLLDAFGSYILLDSNKHTYFFLVNDASSISSQIDVLREHNVSENIINNITKGEKMLYWPIKKSKEEIDKYIFNSRYLGRKREFTYSVLDHDELFGSEEFSLYSSK